MTKPVPGARVVPQPVARSSEEAGSDAFCRRARSADMQQRVENIRAEQRRGRPASEAAPAARAGDVAEAPVASAQDTTSDGNDGFGYAPKAVDWSVHQRYLSGQLAHEENVNEPTGQAALAPADAPTMADRARAKHGLPAPTADAPSGSQATPGGFGARHDLARPSTDAPTLAERMAARHAASAPRKASSPPSPAASAPATVAERMAARHGVRLEPARAEPVPAALIPTRR